MGLRKLNKAEHRKLLGDEDTQNTNENRISLCLFDFDTKPNEISKELDLIPASVGIKGETYKIGQPNNRIERIRDYSHWAYDWNLQTNEFIGDIIERFVKKIIVPRADKLMKLAKSSSVQFQIVQYYYDGCNPGVCIENDIMRILSDINASLDIDIYCLSE